MSIVTTCREKIGSIGLELETNGNLSNPSRKQFWNCVGQLKRLDSIPNDLVDDIADIRDRLYVNRLGRAYPTWKVMLLNNIAGLLFLCSVFLFSADAILMAISLSIIGMTILMGVYYQISLQNWKYGLPVTMVIIFGSIILDILLLRNSPNLLISINKLLVIAAIPCFYLNGRWIGGKVAGISFDGVSRDVFGLFTLKINYQSYLNAHPTQRQWIFFFGGLGTIITALLGASIVFLFFADPWYFLFPILLACGSLLDFMGYAGPLSGSELHHFRRERRIIKDYHLSLG
jgi:hypothetical protein